MENEMLNGFIYELDEELMAYSSGLTMQEEYLNKVVDIAVRYANYAAEQNN